MRLEAEAATIRMMDKTGWSKGRCISYAVEEGYMSLGFLERPIPSEPSPVDLPENADADHYWAKLLAMTTDQLTAELARLNKTPRASLSKVNSVAIVLRSRALRDHSDSREETKP
jgi:hypothetical protein